MTAAEIISKPDRRLLIWASFALIPLAILGVLLLKPSDGIGIAVLGAAAGPFTFLGNQYLKVRSEENKALIAKGD